MLVIGMPATDTSCVVPRPASCPAPDVTGRRSGRAWLVLDNAHRLAGGELLAGLMRAREDTGAEVALLLVGTAPWASGRYLHGTAAELPPKEVPFPAYRPDQLQRVQWWWAGDSGIYLERQRRLTMAGAVQVLFDCGQCSADMHWGRPPSCGASASTPCSRAGAADPGAPAAAG